MLARIRKAQEEREGGFTLIELLVVIIIIGILAAIAIPVFLNQRKKAVDASMKSDLRTVANEEETYYTDFQSYKAVTSTVGPPPTAVIGADTVTLSPGNTVAVILNTAGTAYCITATNPKGTNTGTNATVYVSSAGGLQPTSVVACPAVGSF
jgi:type IV pilus assembly protein PilA